jgi:hypothetical protein
MTPLAITFMVLSMVIVWGGLALSILRLRKDGGYEDEAPHDL